MDTKSLATPARQAEATERRTADPDIKLIRALAVALIFTCHVQEAYGSALAWWFNAGVQVFLFISGFLLGGRTVRNWGAWFTRRFTRVLVPIYLLILIVVAANYLFLKINLLGPTLLATLLCVQDFLGVTLPDCNHLWFIGLILLCYLAVPALQWLRERVTGERALTAVFFAGIPLTLFILYKVIPVARFHYVADISVFAWGYFFASRPECLRAGRRREALRWGSLAAAALLLGGRGLIEYYGLQELRPIGLLYDKLFLPFSKVAFAMAIFFWIYGRRWALGEGRTVGFIDRYSYEIYLVHHLLMFGPFSVLHLRGGFLESVTAAVAATVCAAVSLHWLAGQAERAADRSRRKMVTAPGEAERPPESGEEPEAPVVSIITFHLPAPTVPPGPADTTSLPNIAARRPWRQRRRRE